MRFCNTQKTASGTYWHSKTAGWLAGSAELTFNAEIDSGTCYHKNFVTLYSAISTTHQERIDTSGSTVTPTSAAALLWVRVVSNWRPCHHWGPMTRLSMVGAIYGCHMQNLAMLIINPHCLQPMLMITDHGSHCDSSWISLWLIKLYWALKPAIGSFHLHIINGYINDFKFQGRSRAYMQTQPWVQHCNNIILSTWQQWSLILTQVLDYPLCSSLIMI